MLRPGILWMIFSSFCFILTASFIKAASDESNHYQAVFFRSFIPLLFILLIAKYKGISLFGSKRRLLWLRGIYGAIQLQFYIFSIAYLPLGELSVLISTVPIWIALFSPWISNEKAATHVWLLIPVFMCGMLLIVKPELSWSLVPVLAALSTAIGAAVIQLIIRNLRTSDSPTVIVFYFVFFSSLFALPFVIIYWQALSYHCILLLCASGVSALFAQLSMTQAYRLEAANTVSLFAYTSPIFAYIIGILFFGEHPDFKSYLGASLILASGILTVILDQKKKRKSLKAS